MQKTGFIFDLDGVIVDTAKYHFLAWKKLATQLGISFTEEQNERFKGVSRKRCLEILLDMGKITVSQQQFDTWLFEKNEDFDIIFMDINMPIMDGITANKHIKEKYKNCQDRNPYVIALTAFSLDYVEEMDDLINKPILQMSQLEASLQKYLYKK